MKTAAELMAVMPEERRERIEARAEALIAQETLRQNEHIEWFKRFARAYLRWVNFNFDRIVSDAVKRERSQR